MGRRIEITLDVDYPTEKKEEWEVFQENMKRKAFQLMDTTDTLIFIVDDRVLGRQITETIEHKISKI